MPKPSVPGPGHNSGDAMLDLPPDGEGADSLAAPELLRQFIERIERLEEEEKAHKDDKKDVYSEAKAQGFDTKTMRTIIRLRRMEKDARDEAEALLETYKAALGMD